MTFNEKQIPEENSIFSLETMFCMLSKKTGVDSTNILSAKRTDDLTVIFALLGSGNIKALHW